MGKKNKNKALHYFSSGSSHKSKKDKKNKAPKTHDIKPSLSKKDGKNMAKMASKPIDVPEKFVNKRLGCNHADGTMSVSEAKSRFPSISAFTPFLEDAIEVFGEENVRICERCLDVLVKKDQITADDVKRSRVILYAGMNRAVSAVSLSKDEIKKINETKDKLSKTFIASRILTKVEAEGDEEGAPESPSRVINGNSGAAFMG